MTTIRKFCCNDFLRLASVTIDHFPINVITSMSHCMEWLCKWPNYSHIAIAPGNQIMGYIIGGLKVKGQVWDGLVVFLNVGIEYQRQKLGTRLMRLFEKQMVERMHSTERDAPYMILYVGVFNNVAQAFFIKIGYKVVAHMPIFYSERCQDALEMTKEIAEEKLPSVVRQQFALCNICKEPKSKKQKV